MAYDVPVVLIFGALDIKLLSTGPVPDVETRELECKCFATDVRLGELLAEYQPAAIVSFGEMTNFSNLMRAPFDIRRRWLHYRRVEDLVRVGRETYDCIITDVTKPRKSTPLVSVFTPAYRSGDRIMRPYNSLRRQTHVDWEWVIIDDSDDDGKTFKDLTKLAMSDHRIQVFKPHRHSGNIGELKRRAANLGRGSILVELDHDDELTIDGLSLVVGAFEKYPDAGFAYTDCAEVFEAGGNATYPVGWGFGYGKSYDVIYDGKQYIAQRAPLINPKTIRHIVSSPNHIRAWQRDFYNDVGGHSHLLHVADDYELCVRTFLHTRMVKIEKLGYIQYYNQVGNTQRKRNEDIQRIVRNVQFAYDKRIHDRFLQLGIEDFVWDHRNEYTDWRIPNPDVEQHASLIYVL